MQHPAHETIEAATGSGRVRTALRKRLRPLRRRVEYAASRARGARAESRLRQKGRPDWRDIPIVINNRNRLTYMRRLIDRLESVGCRRVLILDNDSTYAPLLEYYANTPHEVVRIGANLGHRALWRSGLARSLGDGFFAYTDPDVVPMDDCPDDFLELFLDVLLQNRDIDKVGFGLRIDDLPECYASRADVLRWEQQFWTDRHSERFFRAPIDTTFAVYRPWTVHNPLTRCLRSDAPYVAQHLPWYEDSAALTEEQTYYYDNVAPEAAWWAPSAALGKSRSMEGHSNP